jgi:C-terminal processing protease CtpA/Prc
MIRRLTKIGFVFIGIVLVAGGSARADEIAKMTRIVSSMGHDAPSFATLRRACDADAICVAKFLRDRIGDGAELVPQDSPAKKSRGWQKAEPAFTSALVDDSRTLVLVLSRFDAGAVLKVVAKLAATPTRIVLDVRAMEEGVDMDGMRRMVSLFMGHKKRAFQIRYATGKNVDWRIPIPSKLIGMDHIEVMVGPKTNADGEVFAMLLQKYARAEIKGERTLARGFILETIPVMHGWILNVPRARVHIPELDIENGVSPTVVVPE